jgi:hypothetical protein
MHYRLRALRTFWFNLTSFFKAIWRYRHLLWGYRVYDYTIPLSFLHLSLEDLHKELKEYEDLVVKPEGYDIPLRNAIKVLKRLSNEKHFDIAMRISNNSPKKNPLRLEEQLEQKDLSKIFNKQIVENIQSWWI